MNPEQQALLSVAVRLRRPTIKAQQQAERTELRKQAKARRLEILNRRKSAVAAQSKVLSGLRAEHDAELARVSIDLKQALEQADLSLEQEETARLRGIAEMNRLGQYIVAQGAL